MGLSESEQVLIDKLVGQYLIHSYLYYRLYQSIIPDSTFDNICILLDRHYDCITHHHKHLVDKDSLTAGTGFNLGYDDYPLIVQSVCDRITSDNEFRAAILEECKKYEVEIQKLLDKG